MSTFAKNKGVTGEREVIGILQNFLFSLAQEHGLDAPQLKRNLEQSRGEGSDVVGLDWLALEVKRRETLQLNSWWEQVVKAALPGQTPVVMFRQNKQPWQIITMAELSVPQTGQVILARAIIPATEWYDYFKVRSLAEMREKAELKR